MCTGTRERYTLPSLLRDEAHGDLKTQYKFIKFLPAPAQGTTERRCVINVRLSNERALREPFS